MLLDPPALRITGNGPRAEGSSLNFNSPRYSDVNQLTDRGSSALHVAAQGSHVEVVELLLERGKFVEFVGFVPRQTDRQTKRCTCTALNSHCMPRIYVNWCEGKCNRTVPFFLYFGQI